MNGVRSAKDVLEAEFLLVRGKILEVAATLDRLDRGGSVEADPRIKQIQEALNELQATTADRAERIQHIFSDNYQSDWMQTEPPKPRRDSFTQS